MKKLVVLFLITLLVLIPSYYVAEETNLFESNVEKIGLSENKLLTEKDYGYEIKPEKELNKLKLDFNRQDIIEISRDAELCQLELSKAKFEERGLYNKLLTNVEKKFNTLEQQMALIYMGSQNVLDTNEMLHHYENMVLKKWRKRHVITRLSNIEENEDHKKFLNFYRDLGNSLKNDDMNQLKVLLSDNKDYLNNNLTIKKRRLSVYLSTSEIIAQNLDSVSDESRNWLLKNINFDAISVAHAIMKNVTPNIIEELMEVVRDPTSSFFISDNIPTNLLAITLIKGSPEVTEIIIQYFRNYEAPLLTSPINYYVSHLQNKTNLNQSDLDKLNLLYSEGFEPDFLYSDITKGYVLLGGREESLKSNLAQELENIGFTGKVKKNWKKPSQGVLNFKLLQLLEEHVVAYKTGFEEKKRVTKRCDQLIKKQIQVEPKFKDIRDYKMLVKGINGNRDKLSKLETISPTLSDLFIHELLNVNSSSDIKEVDTWISEITKEGIDDIIMKGDNLMPHQQSYLAAMLCEKFGESILKELFIRGWYTQISSAHFQDCTRIIDNIDEVKKNLVDNDNIFPSQVYLAIQNNSYARAKEILNIEKNLNGFEGGRDALALLLDRIVPFRAKFSPDAFELLESLLLETKLKKVHFKRLNRLQLKFPIYYNSLVQKFSELKYAYKYPVSRYTSYL